MTVSRRDTLLALAATGAVTMQRGVAAVLDTDAQTRPTPVNFQVPPGACDCHVHVFCDQRQFPLSPDRTYTPPPAPVEDLHRLLRALHMDRVVIVSHAVYGASNDCTLDAIRRLGSAARGIALLAPETPSTERQNLRRGGIRGLRLNFETFGVTDPQTAIDRFKLASAIAGEQQWHIQINTRLSIVEALEGHILSGAVTVVFDHFAQAQAALGVRQPGFAALIRLLLAGRAYVKLSGAYRISMQAPDYADVAPLAQTLIAANPQRILWGSDWPHPDAAPRTDRRATDLRPPLSVDDGRVLNQLAVWAPESALRHAILVENPARLYGFEQNRS
jgi:predicted TIM-barrel fold metal-dependent hydrolase